MDTMKDTKMQPATDAVIEELSELAEAAERELVLMARVERLEHALRAMTKGYKSVAYAQWPAEMHLANEVLRENT